jgi:hypothetical protein
MYSKLFHIYIGKRYKDIISNIFENNGEELINAKTKVKKRFLKRAKEEKQLADYHGTEQTDLRHAHEK